MENNSKKNKDLNISDIIDNTYNKKTNKDIFSDTHNMIELNKGTDENKIIYDININSIEYLIKYLISKHYDFFTLEPENNKVKITFRKNNIIEEIKYIKYHIYSNILLKAKILTKLDTTNNTDLQEGKTEIILEKINYKIISKTVPSDMGEKLFLKVSQIEKQKILEKKQKMSFGKIMIIFGGLFFISLIVGGVFLTFILFNSTSISDLQFFNNLGIDTNAIKDFAAQLVNITFGIILLIIIFLLFIFSYKALLTKKNFQKQKIRKIIISIFFLVLLVLTLILWMFLVEKIGSLRGVNYGKVEFYDNSKYNSKIFTPEESIININKKLIGPITIRFNDKEFIQKIIDEGFHPQEIIWHINGKKIEKGVEDYELIYKFKEKGLYEIKLTIIGTNIKGESSEKNIILGTINLNNSIKITELKLDNGGSKFIFDATDLKYLGKIKWYYIPSLEGKDDSTSNKIISKALSKELLTGYKFNSKNIFEGEEYYGIKIISGGKKSNGLDKIFVISKGDKTDILGKINTIKDLNNPYKYTLSFNKKEDILGKAYIKEFIWEIKDSKKNIIIKNKANLSNLEDSSKINYIFKNFGIHEIKLTIIDSDNKKIGFSTKINIPKTLSLITKLKFIIDNNELKYKKEYNYDSNDNTYNIDDIKAPSILNVDATKIKTSNQKYALQNVYWDLNNDGIFEINGKKINFNIYTSGLKSFKVKYKFVNKNISSDTIEIIETIHTTSINKEAILDLQIIKKNSYIPITVGFDATNSKVTGKNIDKFIFDYGDGTEPEARDAKNTGHKYIKEGNYIIKLTVVTQDGKKYTINKKLVLKKKQQKAKISNSLNKAPLYQSIDFSAEDSIGEVATYLWDFGDGTISTEISPSHNYKKVGKYKVKLELEFTNRNTLSDEVEIEIYNE